MDCLAGHGPARPAEGPAEPPDDGFLRLTLLFDVTGRTITTRDTVLAWRERLIEQGLDVDSPGIRPILAAMWMVAA